MIKTYKRMFAGGFAAIPIIPDQYWNNVLFLAGYNSNFKDEKRNITPSLKAGTTSIIDSVRKLFGAGALKVSASGSGLSNIFYNSRDFALRGNCTIEGWLYYEGSTNTVNPCKFISCDAQEWSWTDWFVGFRNDNLSIQFAPGYEYYAAIPKNEWFHFAISVIGTVLRIFINGNLVTTINNPGRNTVGDRNGYLSIASENFGQTLTNNNYITASLEELRITAGVGRYSANFVVPNAPYSRA